MVIFQRNFRHCFAFVLELFLKHSELAPIHYLTDGHIITFKKLNIFPSNRIMNTFNITLCYCSIKQDSVGWRLKCMYKTTTNINCSQYTKLTVFLTLNSLDVECPKMNGNLFSLLSLLIFKIKIWRFRIVEVLKTTYHAEGEILAKEIVKIMLSLWWLLPPPDPLLTFIFSLATPLTCNIYRTQEHVDSFTLKIYWIQNTLKELLIF